MDPNAALAYLERHPATSVNDAEDETTEHAYALHEWIATYKALCGFKSLRGMR